jgi:TRAP-type mannitol/chloroaromatic compound transport system permease large subunit
MIGIYMFGAALLLLITGYPVAFIFGLSAMIFGGISAFVNVLPDDWVFLHFFSGWEFSEIK